jgi:hypothetical protein
VALKFKAPILPVPEILIFGYSAAAVELFDDFLDEYSNSSMRPNALFGKSVSLASIGQNEQSLLVMRQFINENPNHPLVGDARQVIDALQ